MSQYAQVVRDYRSQYEQAKRIKTKVDKMIADLDTMNKQYAVMLEAQSLLATVNDENTQIVLDYITGVINKALKEIFPHDCRHIYLSKSLYRGQYTHINVELINGKGKKRSLELQSGTGLRQVVSFLFVISLTEVRKGRRLCIMDELLNGMHKEAKRIVADIMQIFADEGFQFIMVEYGLDNIGKIYLVEKPDTVATVTPLGEDVYQNQVFVFNRPPEDVDLSRMVDESE